MKNLIQQFEEITKIKVFEIEVINKNNEKDYILFDLNITEGNLVAQHEALTEDQELSSKIAFVSIPLDEDFSLDENLQELYSNCIDAISDSTFFTLS